MSRRPENRTQAIELLERTRDFIPYPQVVETTHRGERSWDIFSRLLKDRIVFLGTEVNDDVANIIVAKLLFLERKIPTRTFSSTSIHRAGSSPPGSLFSTRCNTCERPSPPSASGSLDGCRLAGVRPEGQALRSSERRIMIHQPMGGRAGRRPTSKFRRAKFAT